MSRIGKKAIDIPEKVKISYSDKMLTVEGDKGSLKRSIHPLVDLKIEQGKINILSDAQDRKQQALWGLTRSLVRNMVVGVSNGFERVLEINGVGFKVESKDKTITLSLGYSHPVSFILPEGITASIDRNAIKLAGIDKEALGHTAAAIRRLKPPEPYKGKGIKYQGEKIRRKEGKKVVATTK